MNEQSGESAQGISQVWSKIKALFAEAVELDPAIRSSWLQERCRDNPTLGREVASLLEHDQSGDRFLESPAWRLVDQSGTDDEVRESDLGIGPGATVGSWRLVHEISSGGMGTVYLAERTVDEEDEPVQQRAAIKVIRARVDAQLLARRFRRERRILAQLNHPFIARFLESGTLENGLPYFALDYVEGQRIDSYCCDRQLDSREILKLFSKVCSAVAYAHRNLVVHRDLKPSNILVIPDGTPRLLDFGIAKLVVEEDESLEQTQGVGPCTPRYSSPEQIRGEPVTTASDVFALGIILHELMTGTHPFEWADEPGAPTFEVLRRICEEEPEKLYERVVRRESGRENRRIRRLERGDLQSIILKALQKRPGDRYKNIEYLIDDIQNVLEHRSVAARPQRWWYRTRRLIRRHPTAVFSISLATAVGFVALGFIVASGRAARNERDYALQQRELAASSARTMINDLASALENMSAPIERRLELLNRVVGVFDQIDATSRGDSDPSKSPDQVRAEVQTQLILARALLELGDFQSALRRSELAELRTKEMLARYTPHAEDQITLANAVLEKCRALFNGGKVTAASQDLERSITGLRKLGADNLPTNSRRNLNSALCDALVLMVSLRENLAKPEDSLKLFIEAVQFGKLAYESDPADRRAVNSYATSLQRLAAFYTDWARYDLMAGPLKEALAIRRRAVAEAPGDIDLQQQLDRAIAISGSALAFADPQSANGALPGESLSRLRKLCVADPNNMDLTQNLLRELGNYGALLLNQKEYKRAILVLKESVDLAKKLIDENKANFFVEDCADGFAFGLFFSYCKTGDFESARRINLEILVPQTEKLAKIDPNECNNRLRQAYCFCARAELASAIGNWNEAQQMFASTLRNLEENLSRRDYPYERETWATCLVRFGDALGHTGDTRSARRYIEQGLQELCSLRDQQRLPPGSLPDVSDAEEALNRYKPETKNVDPLVAAH
jgi:serine/threonine protein kinase/tetratricopeptide (TPR) repeat protein